ncbi:MAG TPA: tyrosine--tRNA ligase [Elusimicrobiota bacterium]|nr:tyrosine--tRNA ligase [Elusimicrobiota bacterium]
MRAAGEIERQLGILKRGCVSLVSEDELRKKLSRGRPLRVKLGVDPTSPDLHLGHSVVLTKLRAFQDLGHTAVLIIGDYTAMVGDPSGRDSTRPQLSAEEIEKNARTYQDQAFKILDKSKTELRRNSEWLKPFVGEKLLDTLKRHTVQQILAREDFKLRLKENSPLTMLEILYPLLQGYDSIAVKADVELGGNDQLTNLLTGRKMQQDAGQEPQVVLTVPLLVGLDGVKKMSKSYGNAVALTDKPNEMFGNIMKISDELMFSYYELLTTLSMTEVRAAHPMEAKKRLAQTLVERYHGATPAVAAREYFESTFSNKKFPEDAKEIRMEVGMSGSASSTYWSSYLFVINAVSSRKEAQRLIQSGAVTIDGEKLKEDVLIDEYLRARKNAATLALKVGKHKFYRIKISSL